MTISSNYMHGMIISSNYMYGNLYQELLEELNQHGKSIEDIIWVGTNKERVDVDKFLEIAKKTDYDSGFGSQKIAKDLLIVGLDWWIERNEYDGSEWFEFKSLPKIPDQTMKIKRLWKEDKRWATLREINNE